MTSESLGCESIDQEKKVRKRKKKVHAAIREQVYLYASFNGRFHLSGERNAGCNARLVKLYFVLC